MTTRDAQRLRHRPVIGVIACGRAVEGEPAQAVKHRYLEAVEQFAKAVPLIIPSNQSVANAAELIARLDAVLLTGSNSNIAPSHYGSAAVGQAPVDEGRDDFGQAVIHAAIRAGKPVFGVCRGLQEINVAMGGTLRDLRDSGQGHVHHAPPDASLEEMFGFEHEIEIVASSMLHRLVEADRMIVNSVHYQAIDRLGERLVINAKGPGGVIEAVAATNTPAPVFAVQWHPEWRPESRAHDLAFWHYLSEAAHAHYMPAPGSELTA